jgi:hypothetical protein
MGGASPAPAGAGALGGLAATSTDERRARDKPAANHARVLMARMGDAGPSCGAQRNWARRDTAQMNMDATHRESIVAELFASR